MKDKKMVAFKLTSPWGKIRFTGDVLQADNIDEMVALLQQEVESEVDSKKVTKACNWWRKYVKHAEQHGHIEQIEKHSWKYEFGDCGGQLLVGYTWQVMYLDDAMKYYPRLFK